MVTTKPEFDFVFRIKKERYLVMSYLNNQLGYRDALKKEITSFLIQMDL